MATAKDTSHHQTPSVTPTRGPGRPKGRTAPKKRMSLKLALTVAETLEEAAATAQISPSRYIEESILEKATKDKLNVKAFIQIDLDDPRTEELIAFASSRGGRLVIMGGTTTPSSSSHKVP